MFGEEGVKHRIFAIVVVVGGGISSFCFLILRGYARVFRGPSNLGEAVNGNVIIQ